MKVYISTDIGNTNSKGVMLLENGSLLKQSFPTTVTETETGNTLDSSTYRVKIDGRYYVVGYSTKEFDNEKSSDKNTNTHYISALTLITSLIKQSGVKMVETVVLAINMPYNFYTHDVKRQDMLTTYAHNKPITIEVNGEELTFKIEPHLYFEGAGIASKNFELFGEEEVVALMLGSWNYTALTFDENFVPQIEKSHITETGVIRLLDKINNAISIEDGVLRDYKKIEQIIVSTPSTTLRKTKPEEIEIAREMSKTYLEEIKETLRKKKGIDLNTTKFIIAGGGAKLFQDVLQGSMVYDHELFTIDDDALFADCIGAMAMIREQ
jgi:hypothetical protein